MDARIMPSLARAEVLPAKAFCRMASKVWPSGAETKKPVVVLLGQGSI